MEGGGENQKTEISFFVMKSLVTSGLIWGQKAGQFCKTLFSSELNF